MKTTTVERVALLLCAATITIVRELLVPLVALLLTVASYFRSRPLSQMGRWAKPAPPFVHPLHQLLQPLTCAELRRLSGSRSRASKLRLQAAVVG
jgi:hypothetical protein